MQGSFPASKRMTCSRFQHFSNLCLLLRWHVVPHRASSISGSPYFSVLPKSPFPFSLTFKINFKSSATISTLLVACAIVSAAKTSSLSGFTQFFLLRHKAFPCCHICNFQLYSDERDCPADLGDLKHNFQLVT
ncbi:hypothetical protein AAHE18_10G010800 [Arachis hypogaea]